MKIKSGGFVPIEFYGITKDPVTKEFIMIIEFADKGNLRDILSHNFSKILWYNKIGFLTDLAIFLKYLHDLNYCHKDLHSGNILRSKYTAISDFGLSRPANEQKSDNKIYGVLPYIAPEALNGEQYTKASDIYSFGVVMAESSSGKPPFYDKKHDISLSLAVCNGLRPEFEKGTPEFYKILAYRCMNANPDQRPSASELNDIFDFWGNAVRPKTYMYEVEKKYGHDRKEIKEAFEEADKEIPNIS